MIRPARSSSRNTSHVAQRPTRLALAISTRGASGWVANTPTGFPDCTSSVSSSARSEEHTSELQSLAYLVCRLLLEKKKRYIKVYFDLLVELEVSQFQRLRPTLHP